MSLYKYKYYNYQVCLNDIQEKEDHASYIFLCTSVAMQYVWAHIGTRAGTACLLMNEWAAPNFISHFSFPRVPDESRSFHSTSLNSYLDCRMRWGEFFPPMRVDCWNPFGSSVGLFKKNLYLCYSCKSLIKAQYRQYVEVM